MSNRELEARLQWMEDEWNEPSRTDYYLMQSAMEAFFSHRNRPKSPNIGDWKIPFNWSATQNKPKDRLTAAAWAKAKWFALTKTTGDIIKRGLRIKRDE